MSIVFTIYCHTHKRSLRRYIGLTRETPATRWTNHLSAARRGERGPFCDAIRAHGGAAFRCDVLEVLPTERAAQAAEAWWIKLFGSNDLRHGFNVSPGGSGRGYAFRRLR